MLTGKTRYRRNWRGKMILQVEEKRHHMDDLASSGFYDEYATLHWRDAKWDEVKS